LWLTASSPERIDLEWGIRNRGAGRVWIADSWGLDGGIELRMPQPFIAPPADLMYLFARPFQTRTNQFLEGTAHWAQRSIAPGETATGRLQLALPFRLQRDLTSPYEVPLGAEFLNENPKELQTLGAVQLAVQYWLTDPDAPAVAEADPLYRVYVAGAIADGHQNYEGERVGTLRRWSLSNRLAVRVPLADKVMILEP
jgi:hypothetical protein